MFLDCFKEQKTRDATCLETAFSRSVLIPFGWRLFVVPERIDKASGWEPANCDVFDWQFGKVFDEFMACVHANERAM